MEGPLAGLEESVMVGCPLHLHVLPVKWSSSNVARKEFPETHSRKMSDLISVD